ncbi:MAG: 50S ribosomal protein L14e [Candidatus Aenigmarchaeota archaeon ex4484_224]|nr:MAG: 50S ribosomal protein L14e [Candidatus Aenigmarchaeota archaeon ex4484_224]
MAIEVGRICMKIAGRDAGNFCVIVKKINDNFVLVTGPKILTGVRRRRVNIRHIQELPYKIEIKEDASDKEVLDAWEKSGLIKKLGLKKPHISKVKEMEKEESKEEKKVKRKKKKK